MVTKSIWKNFLLLSIGTVLALHVSMASAQDDSETVNTPTGDEECVITDDQYKRIN